MFGRSFDGLDKRFMEPLKENRPQDFEIIKKWFPFVEADIYGWHYFNMKTESKNGQEYQQRAKNETERYKLAVNSNYWLYFSFTCQKSNRWTLKVEFYLSPLQKNISFRKI